MPMPIFLDQIINELSDFITVSTTWWIIEKGVLSLNVTNSESCFLLLLLTNWPFWCNAPLRDPAMFTLSGSSRLHKCFSTSDALVILDPVVPLQVGHQ